jgi:hypothetical protein
VATHHKRRTRNPQGGRGGGPVRIADLLPELAERGGWGQVMDLCRLRAEWGRLVGATVAAHSHPERIGRGRLTVTVDNSAWLMQLSFYRDEMLGKAREVLGPDKVAEVFLKVGRIPREAASRRGAPVPPPPGAARDVEACVAAVEDPEVRAALRSLLLADLSRSRTPSP